MISTKNKLILFAIFILCVLACSTQSKQVYSFEEVEIKPSFQNDTTLTAFHNWVDSHLQWPEDQPDAIGRVIVDFDILPNGKVSNVVVTQGLCESIDRASREVLLQSPIWSPGMINSKKCATRITGFSIVWILK